MLVEAIPTVGKNTQQIRGAILKQVKAYVTLLAAFCGSARVEASLIVHVQVLLPFTISLLSRIKAGVEFYLTIHL